MRWPVAILLAFGSVRALTEIKNGVVGTPQVQCHEDVLVLDIETKAPFRGNIFVKGKSKDPSCTSKFPKNTVSYTSYKMQLGRCGMKRLRQANPHGMSFSLTVIVSFHTTFVTKVDKAYQIRCFYMEPEETVSTGLEVSILPTTILSDRMSMPVCEYSVRRDSPNGPTVSFANVGDKVFHVWECNGPDMGMMVKKCFVRNGKGEEVQVVGYDGCATDDVLLDELTYDASLMRAHAASQIFKYADSNQLYFTCQVKLCLKAMGQCQGLTPPPCTGLKRLKRSAWAVNGAGTETEDGEIDVASMEITVVDIDKFLDLTHAKATNRTERLQDVQRLSVGDYFEFGAQTPQDARQLCVSTVLASLISLSMLSLVCLTSSVSVWCYRRRELAHKLKLMGVPKDMMTVG